MLALILTFSPQEKEQPLFLYGFWITVRQIQSQVLQWDGVRFSFSLGRRPG
ncbi:MAG: hypothetical protein IT579_24220 [Verrucomicrobia subdivision 3 bacterium]|nr:hypothetical protein [Limisphaerales bacterium]